MRQVAVARLRHRRHVQPARQRRDRLGQRMLDATGVLRAPGGAAEVAVRRDLAGRGVQLRQQQRIPARVGRRQQVHGTLVERARRAVFELVAPADAALRVELPIAQRGQRPRIPQGVEHPQPRLAHQAVGGRVRVGAPVPVLEQLHERAVRRMGRGVAARHRQQPRRPGLHEARLVVVVDRADRGFVVLLARREPVADLLRAGAEIEAAVAEQLAGRAIQLAVVGGPQLALRRREHLRRPVRVEPLAAHRTRRDEAPEPLRQPRLRPQPAGDGPADLAVAVGGDQVLVRHAGALRQRQRIADMAHPQHPVQLEVVGRALMRHPVQREATLAVAGHDRRAVDLADRHRHRGASVDLQGLGVRRGLGVGRHLDPVEPLAVGIREAPGHRAVAADDHRRQARQRHAGGAQPVRAAADLELRAVPDGRHAQAQVHVVGQDRAAVRRARTGDRPAVAAQHRRLRAGARRRGRGTGDGCAGRCLGRWSATQVQLLGRRHRRRRQLAAVERRVPAATPRAEPVEDRVAGALAQHRALEASLEAGPLQHEVHLRDHQQRVHRRPVLRPRAQQQVGPGPHRQRMQPGVDALGVGQQQQPVLAGELLEAIGQPRPQPMHAPRAIALQRLVPEQRGQLAGGRAARQVHLEEAFLRMGEAQPARHVQPRATLDDQRAERVAAQAHRRAQAGDRGVAVELRQAGAHAGPDAERQRDQQQRQPDQGPHQPASGRAGSAVAVLGALVVHRWALRLRAGIVRAPGNRIATAFP